MCGGPTQPSKTHEREQEIAMDTSTSDLPAPPVKQLTLIDVSMVRDAGMQALIMLARSLDWNVRHRPNQPVVITSREGIERRIPTNTSIRMSVFQTHLSSIILHSSLEPSAELMEAIIKATKPNREQANRLRLAVGVTVQEHRRIAEEQAAPAEDHEAPLTQTPNIVWEEPPTDATTKIAPPPKSPEHRRKGKEEGPADGGQHGEIKSIKPFLGIVSGKATHGYVYESQSANERVWEDGYVDYSCMICGMAYARPKGVGSHRQIHVKAGEAEGLVQKNVIDASKREATPEEWAWAKAHGESADRQEAKKPQSSGIVGRIVEKAPKPVVDVPDIATFKEEPPVEAAATDTVKLDKILEILLPDATFQIGELINANDDLAEQLKVVKAERDKLRADLKALRDLLGGIE